MSDSMDDFGRAIAKNAEEGLSEHMKAELERKYNQPCTLTGKALHDEFIKAFEGSKLATTASLSVAIKSDFDSARADTARELNNSMVRAAKELADHADQRAIEEIKQLML